MTGGNSKLSLPDLPARQLALATLVASLVALGFWLLFRFQHQLLLVLAGIIVSLAMSPVVSRLRQRGIPPGVAVGLIYLLLAIVVLLFLRFGAPLIGDQVETIGTRLSEGYSSILQSLRETPSLLLRRLLEALPQQSGLPPAVPLPEAADPALAESPFEQGGRYLGQAANVLYQVGAIFLIAFFWTLESERIKGSAVSLLSLNRRESTRGLLVEIEQRVGGYVNGQLLLSLIIGALSLVAYTIIGLPNALALALFVGVMEVIPLIGPLIGAVPAIIIALSVSPLTALWVVLITIIIHQLEANVFGPRVMKKALGMRPLTTLLALTAFGTLFGVLGAIVALPLAAVMQLFFDRYLVDAQSTDGSGGERDRIGVLRYELQGLIEDVGKGIRRREDESDEMASVVETVEDTLEAIALDLDALLAQSRNGEGA